jgi:hypothetical protein
MNSSRAFFAISVFFFMCISRLVFAQEPVKKIETIKLKHKNDVVVMQNGDRNTGEIKKMEFGILYLKSDRVADTMKLDWERVARVQSIAHYEFETINKDYYYGIIPSDPFHQISEGTIRILLDGGGQIDLPVKEIISIREIGRNFLSRMNIAIDAGASFTSANSRTQTNINFSGTFQKPKYSGSLDISSHFSGEPDSEKTSRHEVQVAGRRFLKKKLDALFLGALLRDNQQELNLRTTIGGGLERNLYETIRTVTTVIGGAVYTNEDYFGDLNDRNNAEALAGLTFSTYRFRGSSLSARVFVFPSLSDPGRVRIDSDFDWKWDMGMDFYWNISFTNNYDNRPPPGGINNNLSATTSIGWSF